MAESFPEDARRRWLAGSTPGCLPAMWAGVTSAMWF